MKIKSLGTIILTRSLECSTPDGSMTQVVIEVGRPKKYRSHVSYCPYRITGLGDGELNYAMGGDHLHALLLALVKIGTVVYSSPEAKEERLTWLGDESHNLGLPVSAEHYGHIAAQMKLIV